MTFVELYWGFVLLVKYQDAKVMLWVWVCRDNVTLLNTYTIGGTVSDEVAMLATSVANITRGQWSSIESPSFLVPWVWKGQHQKPFLTTARDVHVMRATVIHICNCIGHCIVKLKLGLWNWCSFLFNFMLLVCNILDVIFGDHKPHTLEGPLTTWSGAYCDGSQSSPAWLIMAFSLSSSDASALARSATC